MWFTYGSLSVLYVELNGNLKTFPIRCSLGNVFTNLLGRQAKGTNLEKRFNIILFKYETCTFGAREEVAPTSPPTTRNLMILTSVGSNFGGILKA